VSALVADVVMPVVGLVLPGGDWRSAGFILREAANPKDNVVVKYGSFLGSVLDFMIIAFVLFLVVSKVVKAAENRFAKKDDAPPSTKECKFCFEIVPVKATRCKACTSELAA
jgi:large conductance mechanosensitive channel